LDELQLKNHQRLACQAMTFVDDAVDFFDIAYLGKGRKKVITKMGEEKERHNKNLANIPEIFTLTSFVATSSIFKTDIHFFLFPYEFALPSPFLLFYSILFFSFSHIAGTG
jgi:hypothetical protein